METPETGSYESASPEHGILPELMDRMAAGDGVAIEDFVSHFRPDLARSVGGILKSIGRSDLSRNAQDFDFLVWTAALAVFDRAEKWNHDGARPWVWAYRAIRSDVLSWVGHASVEFDAQVHVRTECDRSAAGDSDVDLRDLAHRHNAVAGWLSAVEEVANARDCDVHLEYQTQKHLGDHSPAHTVSEMFDLSPSNVRQIDRRVRQKLARHRFGSTPVGVAVVG